MSQYPQLAQYQDLVNLEQVPVDEAAGNAALIAASGVVRSFCKWQISQKLQDTMVVAGNGTRSIRLPTGYVTNVYRVQLDYIVLSPIQWDGTVAGQYGYEWSQSGFIKRAPMWLWPQGERRVTVILDHGYPVIPDEVVGVVCAVAARALDNPESVRSRRVAETAQIYDGAALTAYGLSPNDQATLTEYKINPGRY
jgi:hypothetical protein